MTKRKTDATKTTEMCWPCYQSNIHSHAVAQCEHFEYRKHVCLRHVPSAAACGFFPKMYGAPQAVGPWEGVRMAKAMGLTHDTQ